MADLKSLTARQREIYEYIRKEIEQKGYPPSIRDIGAHFGIRSPNGVMCHLRALEKKGLIGREEKHARAIQIPGLRAARQTIPVLGLVAAGVAIEAVAHSDEIDLMEMLGGDKHFALKVRGQSMIEDHIEDGDLVIIRQQEDAANGTRVIAMIDREVTLKRFYRSENQIRLEPANRTMAPIFVGPDREIQILGVLVGVVRAC